MVGYRKIIRPINASFEQLAKAVVSPWDNDKEKEKTDCEEKQPSQPKKENLSEDNKE